VADDVSYWLSSTPPTSYPTATAADELHDLDVAVIGGGIAGLCAAWTLTRAGRRVAVFEAGRIAHATTGNTTAKVTALHSAVYHHLGPDKALLYARSQQSGLRRLHEAATEVGAQCDWEARPAYTYAVGADAADSLREEAQAAAEAGLPAEFVTTADLPYPVAGAVRVADQAQFHPRRFLLALVDDLVRLGGRIYEQAQVTELGDGTLTLAGGQEVTAYDIVVTTGFPAFDRPELFARLVPKRELVVAAAIPAEADPGGMFLGIDDDRSVRTTPLDDGRRLLIVTGETYQPGDGGIAQRYAALTAWTGEHFPIAGVAYRWSAQDYTTTDRIPFGAGSPDTTASGWPPVSAAGA
jgi:glycine/D-amino acid oxidase-like deaminating enzyme